MELGKFAVEVGFVVEAAFEDDVVVFFLNVLDEHPYVLLIVDDKGCSNVALRSSAVGRFGGSRQDLKAELCFLPDKIRTFIPCWYNYIINIKSYGKRKSEQPV